MNRLQNKCLIASLALHALLCAILVVGPAFLSSRQRDLDLPILEVIPDRLTDLPFSGGGNPNAKPPPSAPRPMQPPEPQPPVQTKPSQPVVKPVEAKAKLAEPPKEKETKPGPEAVSLERKKSQIKVDNKIVRRPSNKTPDKNTTKAREDDSKAQAEARRRTTQQLLARINGASERINDNLSPGTTIEPLGPGGAAYANYSQVVKTIYDRAWIDPEDVSDDDATVQVKVIIARDGRVISDAIVKRSGVPALDKSIQNALDRVRQLPPFPEGAKEAERIFIINFNLKAKRLLG